MRNKRPINFEDERQRIVAYQRKEKIKLRLGLIVVASFLTLFFVSLYLIATWFITGYLVLLAGIGFFGAVFSMPIFFIPGEDK